MNQYTRILDLTDVAKKRSLFLFGPRQTGKTSLLKKLFPQSPFYNLLLADQFGRISYRPNLLREELLALPPQQREVPVVIDEVQKLPLLLDEAHFLIEEYGFHFILTGSSARKLKRGGANLLGGRAWTRYLHPLVSAEIGTMDLVRAVNFGTLPSVYTSDYPEEDLAAYCGLYLAEEIQAEGIVRRVDNFSRFLHAAALVNTELINFESVARDAQVPPRTIREYFSILEDTLVGSMLQPYAGHKTRKAIAAAKFYMFDIGVCNFLSGRKNIALHTELFGKSFEQLIFLELQAYTHYTSDTRQLSFYRDYGGNEIDFILGSDVAIEVKSTAMVTEKHCKGMKKFLEDNTVQHAIIVSLDDAPRKIGNIDILPWREFLARLWGGALR